MRIEEQVEYIKRVVGTEDLDYQTNYVVPLTTGYSWIVLLNTEPTHVVYYKHEER